MSVRFTEPGKRDPVAMAIGVPQPSKHGTSAESNGARFSRLSSQITGLGRVCAEMILVNIAVLASL
jgi:hypothetical protein